MSKKTVQIKQAAEWVPIERLLPWVKNPRKNDAAVDRVSASIRAYGFGAPLLARRENGEVIAGHTRLKAAMRMGLTEVPVRYLDLDETKAHALALADNRIGEVAEWDEEMLAQVLKDLDASGARLDSLGFSEDELAEILAEAGGQHADGIDEGEVNETPPKDPVSETGKVYRLGDHRLMCGDSTDVDVVRSVVGDEPVDLLFTDPPYGVSYQSHMAECGTASRFEEIENDDLKPDELRAFLSAVFSAANKVMRAGAAVYVCHANRLPGIYAAFEGALLDNDFTISAVIVWVKPAATMGWQDYRSQYEPILYGWKMGAARRKVEDRTQTNVWDISRDAAAAYVHPTQKPVELPARAIRNSTAAGDIVLDLFGGSGSTLIAAAKTGRKARLVEKDAGYCDVIRRRWGNFARKAGLPVDDGLDGGGVTHGEARAAPKAVRAQEA